MAFGRSLAAEAARRRLGGPPLAARVRRSRRDAARAVPLRRGVHARRRAADDRHRRRPRSGRPDADPSRHRGAEAPLPAAHPHRRRRLVPGLLRAQRRLRPGRTAAPAPTSTATSSASPARRSGPATPASPTGASWSCAPIPQAPKHQGLTLPAGRHEESRHHDPAARRDDRRRLVQRGVLRRRARAAREHGRPS